MSKNDVPRRFLNALRRGAAGAATNASLASFNPVAHIGYRKHCACLLQLSREWKISACDPLHYAKWNSCLNHTELVAGCKLQSTRGYPCVMLARLTLLLTRSATSRTSPGIQQVCVSARKSNEADPSQTLFLRLYKMAIFEARVPPRKHQTRLALVLTVGTCRGVLFSTVANTRLCRPAVSVPVLARRTGIDGEECLSFR